MVSSNHLQEQGAGQARRVQDSLAQLEADLQGQSPRDAMHPVLSSGHRMWAGKNCLWLEVGAQNRHAKHPVASLPLALLLPLARCHQQCYASPVTPAPLAPGSCCQLQQSPHLQLWLCLWPHNLQHPSSR